MKWSFYDPIAKLRFELNWIEFSVIATCWAKQYGFNLVRHSWKKAIVFAEIWTWDPDHNPERTYALDRWAMAPIILE